MCIVKGRYTVMINELSIRVGKKRITLGDMLVVSFNALILTAIILK